MLPQQSQVALTDAKPSHLRAALTAANPAHLKYLHIIMWSSSFQSKNPHTIIISHLQAALTAANPAHLNYLLFPHPPNPNFKI